MHKMGLDMSVMFFFSLILFCLYSNLSNIPNCLSFLRSFLLLVSFFISFFKLYCATVVLYVWCMLLPSFNYQYSMFYLANESQLMLSSVLIKL